MVPAVNRPANLVIDLEAIHQNIANELKHMDPHSQMWAVVKANGYGHGAVAVAKVALRTGAKGLCVANLDEAIQLREAQLTCPILVLGITPADKAVLAASFDISLTVGDLAWLQAAQKLLQAAAKRLKIHLGIDSGMGRIGFSEDGEFLAANDFLKDNQSFGVEGMFTHFATADSADPTYFDYQVKRFDHMKSLLKIKPRFIHCDNTAASIFGRQVKTDIVRFGIGIYGLNPSSTPTTKDLKSEIALKPALSFVSELSFVKQVHQGMGVGYGATYKADGDHWIGTVPVGYADGWQRSMQGFKVKVGADYCPIVGRVCMDQFMVEMPKRYPVGTKVELIAADAQAPNSIKKVADQANTIHYEIACLLSDRLPRVYLQAKF